MFICKTCQEIYDDSMRYSKDSRYCTKCGKDHTEFLSYRREILASLRSMPLEAKIVQTKFLIRKAVSIFGEEKCYISYSGGKDSTVLSHITKQLYPNILHLFANTTNEYPETLKHVQWEKNENGTNIITVFPIDTHGEIWTFKKVVKKYGYPMFSKRISNAIRTYQHARTEYTKQNSINYINNNFKKYEKWFSAMRQLYPHSCLDGIIDNEFSTDNTKIFLDNMNEDTYPKFLKHVVEVITKRKKYLDGF